MILLPLLKKVFIVFQVFQGTVVFTSWAPDPVLNGVMGPSFNDRLRARSSYYVIPGDHQVITAKKMMIGQA